MTETVIYLRELIRRVTEIVISLTVLMRRVTEKLIYLTEIAFYFAPLPNGPSNRESALREGVFRI